MRCDIQSVTNKLLLCYHDVVKIIRGNYDRYFAIFAGEGENLKNLQKMMRHRLII